MFRLMLVPAVLLAANLMQTPAAAPTYDVTYTLDQGTAKVSADKKTASGDATIGGACVEQPTAATFSFTRK